MNNVKQRLSVYFKHHIAVSMVVVPPPSTVNEANHIFNNFKTIGHLEYFKIDRDGSRINMYGPVITAVYNPNGTKSLLSSALYKDEDLELNPQVSSQDLMDEQQRISTKLQTLLALPRYSYIENDDKYLQRQLEIPFKHKLTSDGRRYENLYSLNSSTIDNQFIYITTNDTSILEDLNQFKSKVRFNFQKFHKFDRFQLDFGINGINRIVGYDKFKPQS